MVTRILVGHVIDQLRSLPDESVHMVVTSPPYLGLRSYGTPPQVWGGDPDCRHQWEDALWRSNRWGAHDNDKIGEKQGTNTGSISTERGAVKKQDNCSLCGAWRGDLGLEPTPALFIEHLVMVFREVRRVLRKDGTCWLNLGDSYAGSWGAQGRRETPATLSRNQIKKASHTGSIHAAGLKPKDRMMIPARAAIALQEDGWWLRDEIVWQKPNPMPSSVLDRTTPAHEMLYLLSRSPRYYYDAEAIKEPAVSDHDSGNGYKRDGRLTFADANGPRGSDKQWQRKKRKTKVPGGWDTGDGAHGTIHRSGRTEAEYVEADEITHRNKRSVWTIATSPYPEAHFATFPPDLVEPCILAGTSEYGVCGNCGGPWERVVEKQFTPQQDVSEERGVRCAEGQKPMDETSGWPGVPRGTTSGKTLRWRSTCSCGPDSGIKPAVVCDPFSGAFTTALVADRLGRDCIGIELSPTYAELGRKRLTADAGLFANVATS